MEADTGDSVKQDLVVTKDIPRQLKKDGKFSIFNQVRCNYHASIIRRKYKDYYDHNDVWKLSCKCSNVSNNKKMMNYKGLPHSKCCGEW